MPRTGRSAVVRLPARVVRRAADAQTTKKQQMYGVIIMGMASVEMYDRMHAEMKRQTGTSVDGCLAARRAGNSDEFEVLEVCASKEQQFDRANAGIVFPLMRKLACDQCGAPDRASYRSLRGSRACHCVGGIQF